MGMDKWSEYEAAKRKIEAGSAKEYEDKIKELAKKTGV